VFKEYYSTALGANYLKLLGSSDLIGNPTNLVKNLGSGFKELRTAPAEGFSQGLVQGSFGIVKGAGGAAKHTLAGVSGTLSRFTRALNKPIVMLSFDKEYIHEKEIKDFKIKPKGVVQGLGMGAKALGTSIMSGAKGIVAKPMQGAKQTGLTGFITGTFHGVCGAVVKPVAGAVDFFSKTTQGIENHAIGSPDCPISFQLQR